MEEEQLKTAAKKAALGDEAAFVEVCGYLKRQIYQTAIGILGNESLAYDAVDETVYKAFRGIKKLREPQYIRTWFMRITINTCHDILRKRRKEERGIPAAAETVSDNYERLHSEELLRALPEDLRQIISLKYFSDFTLTEIAEVLQMPLGTVKSKLNRALKLLRLEVDR